MRNILFVFSLLILQSAFAQDSVELHPFRKDGKWGMYNQSGEVVVPAIYDKIHPFSEGLAAVEKHQGQSGRTNLFPSGSLGYIDTQGKLVIPMKYSPNHLRSVNFSEGLAGVLVNNKFGYIDREGKMLIQSQYMTAYPFSESIAVVEYDRLDFRVIDREGRELFSLLERVRTLVDSTVQSIAPQREYYSEGKFGVRFYQDGKAKTAVFDPHGELLFVKDLQLLHHYNQGFAPAKVDFKQGWGFVDEAGNLMLPYEYAEVSGFKDNVAVVKSASTGKMGIINTDFEFQVGLEYDQIFHEFESDRFLVRMDYKYGFIDSQGNVIIDLVYESAIPFSEGLTMVKKDGVYWCLDPVGELVFQLPAKPEVTWVEYEGFTNGLLKVAFDGLGEHYIDRTGKIVAKY